MKHEYESLEECLIAMIGGEEFWYKEYKISYESRANGTPGFWVKSISHMEPLHEYAKNWRTWTTSPNWKKIVSESTPVLCKNGDGGYVKVYGIRDDRIKCKYTDVGYMWIQQDISELTPVASNEESLLRNILNKI